MQFICSLIQFPEKTISYFKVGLFILEKKLIKQRNKQSELKQQITVQFQNIKVYKY